MDAYYTDALVALSDILMTVKVNLDKEFTPSATTNRYGFDLLVQRGWVNLIERRSLRIDDETSYDVSAYEFTEEGRWVASSVFVNFSMYYDELSSEDDDYSPYGTIS